MKPFVIALAILALVEGGIRVAGLADSPLHTANKTIGYIPSASQDGRFLANRWYINDRHMNHPEKFNPSADFVLLVGDSVVFGGNPLDQSERLGSRVEQATHSLVYPIAAGSWGLANELAYLRANPDVASNARQIVFVLNEGDFSGMSSWRCESFHPTRRPVLHSLAAARKYLGFLECHDKTPSDLMPPPVDLSYEFDRFMSAHGGKSHFVIYPSRDGLQKDFSSELTRLSQHVIPSQILNLTNPDVQRRFGWAQSMYRDSIHPTAEGTKVLGETISTILATQTNAISQ